MQGTEGTKRGNAAGNVPGRNAVESVGPENAGPASGGILRGKLTLKRRLMLLIIVLVVPMVAMVFGIIAMIRNYSDSYNRIMANLKTANEYNIKFKQDMEYSMYRVMIGLIDVDKFKDGDILEGSTPYATVVRNPYNMIRTARADFSDGIERTAGTDEDIKIKGILYCLDSLEKAVNRMIENSRKPGTYDENNAIWENDIQGLCSMIQEYITQYVYYETLNMEELQKELEYHTSQAVAGSMILLVVILVTGAGMTAILTKSVTDPIGSLQATAESLGRGDLDARAGMGSLEEINVLARTFNTMSDRIVNLMEKTRQEQENLKNMELKLLQEQINPHFLYNTLDSIVWMAEGGNNRQVVEMTTDLSDFFRTVLSEGRDFVTVGEEEGHIRSYLKIQKIRYEDILDYRISIDPSVRQKIVLKMILQPVVENALYHGIKNKRGGGTITVRGYEDSSGLVFEVEDDGIGMEQEVRDRLRGQLEESGGVLMDRKGSFGLKNVVQRIRMYYGEDSGITIESERNVGTCVKIYLGHDRKKT